MRDDGVAYIDENLEILNSTFLSLPDGPADVIEKLYEASDSIAGTAALFGFNSLGKAAYSLCQLLSYADRGAGLNRPAVKAHLDGMQMLRRFADADPAATKMILDNLSRLLAHLAPKR